MDVIEHLRGRPRRTPEPTSNTTIGIIATNAALNRDQALRLATMAHDGIARTIRPSHTPSDGDTIFSLASGAVEIDDSDVLALGALGARAMERAILRAVVRAETLGGVPSVRELESTGSNRS